MTDEQTAAAIAALIRERAGYEQRGDKARVAEVDRELSRLGGQAKAPTKRAQTRTGPKAKAE